MKLFSKDWVRIKHNTSYKSYQKQINNIPSINSLFKTVSSLNPPKILFKHKRRAKNSSSKEKCHSNISDYHQNGDISVLGRTCRLKNSRFKNNKTFISNCNKQVLTNEKAKKAMNRTIMSAYIRNRKRKFKDAGKDLQDIFSNAK